MVRRSGRSIGFYKDSSGRVRPITPKVPLKAAIIMPKDNGPWTEKNGERIWEDDTKNKYPSLQQTTDYLKNDVSFFGVQRLEGNLSTDDFSWHKFKTLKEADDYIREMSRTAPPSDKGYDKAHVDILFKDHRQRGLRIDLNSGNYKKIEDEIYQSDKYYAEHPDIARRFGYVPYVKFGKDGGRN